MRSSFLLPLLTAVVLLSSCEKDSIPVDQGPPPAGKAGRLKEIVIPNLPSPYFHFDYDNNGRISSASFASGLRSYTVSHAGNAITEMRSNTATNQDRLEYVNNEGGKVELIKYLDKAGTVYKIVNVTYQDGKLRLIEWERKVAAGFLLERTVSFIYDERDNLRQMTDHRHDVPGQQETTYVTDYLDYDDNLNVDGFSVFHKDGDHLLLFAGVKLQKNNPRKVNFSGNGGGYTIDYTYTYLNRAPNTRHGEVLITEGPNAGQRFQTNATYSYY